MSYYQIVAGLTSETNNKVFLTDNSSVSAILNMMIYMWVLVLWGFRSISLDD